jgi:transglutaminase-like putative cysteine protease
LTFNLSPVRLNIHHTTSYRYARTVNFGPHLLMVRPREGHSLHIESSQLEIYPEHRLRWIQDIYGNSIARVEFPKASNELRVISQVTVQHYDGNPFDFILAPHAVTYPFTYDAIEQPDVAPYLIPDFPDAAAAVKEWIRPFSQPGAAVPTLDLLTQLNQEIRVDFGYARREEAGVQNPAETILKGSGSCRDFAVLFMEACRHLGLAARFVSGYLHTPQDPGGQHGSTHAWADVYLPGAGWKGFDPTGGMLACDLHVPVGVARHPAGAAPISGSFSGGLENFLGMQVDVQVMALS